MSFKLNPELRKFWSANKVNGEPVRNRVLYGGRMSGKSWDAAAMSVLMSNSVKLRILCARKFQNKIAESVHALIAAQANRMGFLRNFDVTNNSIKNLVTGSEFIFSGIWGKVEELKSIEDIDILWIEESQFITKSDMDILTPTIRSAGSQIWLVFNPNLVSDFVWQKYVLNPPPGTISKLINYDSNPFLSETALSEIEICKNDDYDDYLHFYRGIPRSESDDSIIKRSWLEAAVDAHKKIKPKSGTWTGKNIAGFDVMDGGKDKNAIVNMNGSVCDFVREWSHKEDEMNESCSKVLRMKVFDEIGYDSIGVGSTVGSHFNTLKFKRHYKFNAGAEVHKPNLKDFDTKIKNRDFFENLKAQAWWDVARRLKNTYRAVEKGDTYEARQMISISSEIAEQLLNKMFMELTCVNKDTSERGKTMAESKKKLKKRDINSPNIADAFIIANSRHLVSVVRFEDLVK